MGQRLSGRLVWRRRSPPFPEAPTLRLREMSELRMPRAASSMILLRLQAGRGRPFRKSPPSWFMPLGPRGGRAGDRDRACWGGGDGAGSQESTRVKDGGIGDLCALRGIGKGGALEGAGQEGLELGAVWMQAACGRSRQGMGGSSSDAEGIPHGGAWGGGGGCRGRQLQGSTGRHWGGLKALGCCSVSATSTQCRLCRGKAASFVMGQGLTQHIPNFPRTMDTLGPCLGCSSITHLGVASW